MDEQRYYTPSSYHPGGVPVNNMQGMAQHPQRAGAPGMSGHPQQPPNNYYQNYSRGPMQPMQQQRMNMSTAEMNTRPMSSTTNQSRMLSASMGSHAPSRGHPQGMQGYNQMMNSSQMYPTQQHNVYQQNRAQQLSPSDPSFDSEFPALGGSSSNDKSSKDYTLNQEDFPSLGSIANNDQPKDPNKEAHPSYSNRPATGQYEQQMGNFPKQQQQPSSTATVDNRYGLLGLLSLIHNPEPDNLAIGIDLTTLGLNLNAPSTLYNTFTSPFADSRTGSVEKSSMRSYKQPPMQPVHEKVGAFDDGTLFFMFYGVTQDHMQLVASDALHSRGWRYHKKDHHWYRPSETSTPGKPEFDCFEPTTWKVVKKTNFSFQPQDFEVTPPPISK